MALPSPVHVWAEVHHEDGGWVQVDPTVGLPCGSDYVPFAGSEDGEMTLVYASPVIITIDEETP